MEKTKRNIRLITSLLLTIFLLSFTVMPANAVPAGYSPEDVSALNSVIQNNGLTGFQLDEPENWTFAVWTSDPVKRVVRLDFNSKGMSGDLDLSALTALEYLTCYNNAFESLDLSGLGALNYIDCGNNALESLDVGDSVNLKELYCASNQLTALDLTGLTALTRLSCHSNGLAALDLSDQTALVYLDCGNNNLTALDLTNNTALTNLYCSANALTALEINHLTQLTEAKVYLNSLSELEISALQSLVTLDCGDNNLTALDVSGLTALVNLFCSTNQLSQLKLNGCTSLAQLVIHSNAIDNTGAFTTPDGHDLILEPATGGTIVIQGFDPATSTFTLEAVADEGAVFKAWESDTADLAAETDATLELVVEEDITVRALFILLPKAGVPTVTDITETGAKFSGTYGLEGGTLTDGAAKYRIRKQGAGDDSWTLGAVTINAEAGTYAGSFAADGIKLSPNTAYELQVYIENEAGGIWSDSAVFQTLTPAPNPETGDEAVAQAIALVMLILSAAGILVIRARKAVSR